MTIVANGVWCQTCEFFEEPALTDIRCDSCGCPPEVHREAVVMVLPEDVPEPEVTDGEE